MSLRSIWRRVVGDPAPEPEPKKPGPMGISNSLDAARAMAPWTEYDGYGVMGIERRIMMGGTPSAEQTRGLMMSYHPRMEAAPADERGNRLSAAVVTNLKKRNRRWFPPFYMNPRQGVDYHIIDTVMTMTPCQHLMNIKMRLIMGTGFGPKIYLKKPTGEEEADEAERQKYTYLEDILEAMDRRVSDGDGKRLRMSLVDQFAGLIRAALTYNRGVLIKHVGPPLEVDGTAYPGLPEAVTFVHPKDLGMIKVDARGDLEGVMWMYGGLIEVPEMVYLWNSSQGEERSMTKFYGLSSIDGALVIARQLFQTATTVIPVMQRSSFSGSGIVVYDAPGIDDDVRQREADRLAASVRPGSVSVATATPLNVGVHTIPIDPKIGDTAALRKDWYKELCMAFDLPATVVFDEGAANRATLVGKLQYTGKTVIKPIRDWVDREVCSQWYGPALKAILKARNEEALLEDIGVRIEFEDLDLAEDEDLIEKVEKLNQLRALKTEAIGRMLGIKNLANDVDEGLEEERRAMGPMGQMGTDAEGGGPMEVEDEDSGRKFRVK